MLWYLFYWIPSKYGLIAKFMTKAMNMNQVRTPGETLVKKNIEEFLKEDDYEI